MFGAAAISNPTFKSIVGYTYWDNFDIAMLRLASNIAFTSKIRPIRLPALSQQFNLFLGNAQIQGYGGGRPILQYGNVIVQSRSYTNYQSCLVNICSIGANLVTTAEPGDSGNVF